jgi:chromosome segregation ATPase
MSLASNPIVLSRIARLSAVALVVSFGLWGCARKAAGPSANADRARALETRCKQLNQEYLRLTVARDKAKSDMAAMEKESARLDREAGTRATLLKERDELRAQLKAAQAERDGVQQTLAQRTSERDEVRQELSVRLSERDALQGRCDRMRQGLQALLSQDDAPAGTQPPSPSPSAASPAASTPAVVTQTLGGQS